VYGGQARALFWQLRAVWLDLQSQLDIARAGQGDCQAHGQQMRREVVARIERSEARGGLQSLRRIPDFTAFNPGYLLQSQFDLATSYLYKHARVCKQEDEM
jgi:hypothetical protein